MLYPLNRWLHLLARVRRHYFDKDKDEVQTRPDQGTVVDGPGKRYRYLHRDVEGEIAGHLVTVVEQEDGTLHAGKHKKTVLSMKTS